MGEEIRGAFPAMTVREGEILDSCLSGLKSVRDTLKAVVDFGLQQLRSSAVKPRLHTWIDQFASQSHQLSEVQKNDSYHNIMKIYRKNLIGNYDTPFRV